MHALRYALDEAVTSLWRGRRSGALSMATMAVALFVLGGVLIVTSNLDRLSAEWAQSAEISVYLHEEVTPAERDAIERLLVPAGGAASFEFVSKDEALRRFKDAFADLAASTDVLGRNPLPASYEVRVVPPARGTGNPDALVTRLLQTPGVADVRFDRQWLDRLLSAVAAVRGVGLALGALLTVAAAFTVANVVRLALFERRDELEIMELVGAPRVFVQGPFVMEGVLQGGVAAAVALAALAALFIIVSQQYLAPLTAAAHLPAFRFLPIGVCVGLVAGGVVVGGFGGAVAAAGRTP